MASSDILPTIDIQRDVIVKWDWKEFSAGLVEVAANALLKGWADGGVSAIASAGKLIFSSSKEESAEALSWRLVALCFAWALDDLKGREELDIEQLRSAMREALNTAKLEVDDRVYVISRTFFDNPSSLPLFQLMRDTVVKRRIELGLKAKYSDLDLVNKFNVAFNLGVFEIWSKEPKAFSAISNILLSPVSVAAEREINWASYRQGLVHSFEVRSTFGQESSGISLSQIYVPLRGYWEDDESSETRRERNYDGRIPKHAHGVLLDDCLDTWIESDDDKDWLRLIGGGPGSGKSTTLRALACRLAGRPSYRPLFIPLQHIGITSDLRASINNYFTQRSGSAFSHEPLSRSSIESGPPLVLIFDGLDELVTPNENSKETISLFIHKLNSLVADMRGDHALKLRVIVSGRMLAFQSARKLLTIQPSGCLEVYGYLPASQRGLTHPSEIWNIDQRETWWVRYATALGLDVKVPEAFSVPELASITHEPLLAYLLVLAGFSSHNWERAAENPNRIYATLMSDIYNRGWGEAGLKTRRMTSSEFNRLMQTIGLAAWLGGDTRVTTESAFLSTIAVTRAEDAWDSFNEDQGHDVTNLAMNFYLKAADSSGRGFEFTHKSFGEYLAALAILEVALSMNSMTTFRLEYALQEWFSATGAGNMTSEIIEFLRREVRLRWHEGDDNQRKAFTELKEIFERVAGAALITGFSTLSGQSWRTNERKQINAEAACWAIINAIVRAKISDDKAEIPYVSIPHLEGAGVRKLLNRHSFYGIPNSGVFSCLTALKIPDLYLFGYVGHHVDLSYCKIEHLIIEGGYLYGADFSFSKLQRLSVYSCQINDVDFNSMECERIHVVDSKIEDCNFEDVQCKTLRLDNESVIYSFPAIPKFGGCDFKLFAIADEGPDVIERTKGALLLIETLERDTDHGTGS